MYRKLLILCQALLLTLSVSAAPHITSARLGETAHRAALPTVLQKIARGLGKDGETLVKPLTASPPNKDIVNQAINRVKTVLDEARRDAADEGYSKRGAVKKPLSPDVQRIARAGAIFIGVADLTSNSPAPTGRVSPPPVEKEACPYNKTIVCDPNAKFRTIDGSCNNLQNPIWGKSNTPFERFLPPHYGDGYNSPRNESVYNTPLPLPRVVSTTVHKRSNLSNLHPNITHLTMEFGHFLGHDMNLNVLASLDGARLQCCNDDGTIDTSPSKQTLGCLPIEIPEDDSYFKQFNKTCINFARSLGVQDLECKRGYREQLNQVSHFMDASTVYGSDEKTQEDLRTKTDGLLKVTCSDNGDLLYQASPSIPAGSCASSDSRTLFKAGDERVNLQPALMAVHTIFLREHNRIARQLKDHNPTWDDERLYQEARKIVGAEIQHITYTEYLPTILSTTYSSLFGFRPQRKGQYFSEYDPSFKPEIRSAFIAAAFRFGHSVVRDHVAPGILFKDAYFNPHLLYQQGKGLSFVIENLIQDHQQKFDNLLTTQLTNHLFELRGPGTGSDIASFDVQRGRDHGMANYNEWRVWCGLPPAKSFNTAEGGLVDHSPQVAELLSSVYSHPDDIDLVTGLMSESPIEDASIGHTGACIVSRQFWILKRADRFYYETDNAGARFTMDQLDEIRKVSLAKIICDNTNITTMQPNVFRDASVSGNGKVSCSSLAGIDLSKWSDCTKFGWSSWSTFSPCVSGERSRSRTCQSACREACVGPSFELVKCGDEINFPN